MVHQERVWARIVTAAMNVIFFGTPSFSLPCLEALLAMPSVTVKAVVTQPDRPAGRGGELRASPVKELALQRGIPVLQPLSLRKELASFKADADKLGPFDVGVVIAFGQILPKAVLEMPRAGCVNVHASLLPRWRGAAPIQRAIEAGDIETGVCLMQMDEGLDTGAVFSRASTPIAERDNAQALHDSLASLGASLLKRDLPAIAQGSLAALPQEAAGVTYAHKIEAHEGLIDWSSEAGTISRRVRALAPHPGCYTFWRGQRMKILSAGARRGSSASGHHPGEVISAVGSAITVACGSGELSITQLQLAGKRQMSTEEFLRGTGVVPGERFSSTL